MITAIASASGGFSGGRRESGKIFSGVNSAIGGYGLGNNNGDEQPAAYLNYILFDLDYKVMDMGWAPVPANALNTKRDITISDKEVTEPGYLFVYLSYEDLSNNYVEFDDLSITQTKSRVVQYNEYPFGMRTQRSCSNKWKRKLWRNSILQMKAP